jgi:predicted RNA-binding protein YlxR (DUF448 family)/ribosomal protein L30E
MLELATNVEEMGAQGGRSRRCIVQGDDLSRDEGIRFVVGPENNVVPDILSKLPGRGFWVGADRSQVNAAVEKNRFARAARRQVLVTPNLSDQVELLLAKRCIDLIALARRAGEAVAGYEKTKAWITDGSGDVLVQAEDCAQNARDKFKALSKGSPVVRVLRVEELGQAFGRDRTVHVVLAHGGLADKLRTEARRLNGFRTAGGEWGNE